MIACIQACTLAAAAWVLYATVVVIRRLYFSPLSNFPGPKLAAATLWYEFFWDVVNPGFMIWRIQDMHRKYGE